MKNKYIYIEFILIFLLLVVPPIFNRNESDFSALAGFNLTSIILFSVSAVIFAQCRMLEIEKRRSCRILVLSTGTKTFAYLMLVFAFFQAIDLIFNIDLKSVNLNGNEMDFFSWTALVVNVAFSAFYEEVIYRMYVPDMLLHFARSKKRLFIPIEIGTDVLFALAHGYLGILPVINAFICGLVLRRCKKLTGSVIPGLVSHFAYNFTLLLFSAIL